MELLFDDFFGLDFFLREMFILARGAGAAEVVVLVDGLALGGPSSFLFALLTFVAICASDVFVVSVCIVFILFPVSKT